jgi:hypothetical protein
MGRVRIGTCSGPAEAALVRAAFEAHDIPIVINAEQHASILGGLGGAFVPLHIYVSDDRAEEAAALLEDLRAHEAREPEPADEADQADQADEADEEASDGPPIEVRTTRRRRTVAVVLLGLCITFGTAHMLTGAWLRGMALAGLEVLAIKYLAAGEASFGTILLFGCIITDLVGALWRVHTSKPELPVARARRVPR